GEGCTGGSEAAACLRSEHRHQAGAAAAGCAPPGGCLGAENEDRQAVGRVPVCVEVGTELREGRRDSRRDLPERLDYLSGPIRPETSAGDLLVEFIAIQFGGDSIGVQPEVQLEIEILVVVGLELRQWSRKVDVITDRIV